MKITHQKEKTKERNTREVKLVLADKPISDKELFVKFTYAQMEAEQADKKHTGKKYHAGIVIPEKFAEAFKDGREAIVKAMSMTPDEIRELPRDERPEIVLTMKKDGDEVYVGKLKADEYLSYKKQENLGKAFENDKSLDWILDHKGVEWAINEGYIEASWSLVSNAHLVNVEDGKEKATDIRAGYVDTANLKSLSFEMAEVSDNITYEKIKFPEEIEAEHKERVETAIDRNDDIDYERTMGPMNWGPSYY